MAATLGLSWELVSVHYVQEEFECVEKADYTRPARLHARRSKVTAPFGGRLFFSLIT